MVTLPDGVISVEMGPVARLELQWSITGDPESWGTHMPLRKAADEEGSIAAMVAAYNQAAHPHKEPLLEALVATHGRMALFHPDLVISLEEAVVYRAHWFLPNEDDGA